MDFDVTAISRAFWHHFRHLRLVDVDDFGIEIRVLSVMSCGACRRLWESLTPVTIHGHEIYPAAKAERYHALRRQAFLRDDLVAAHEAAWAPAPRGARRRRELESEPVSLVKVKRLTDYRVRRPLERY